MFISYFDIIESSLLAIYNLVQMYIMFDNCPNILMNTVASVWCLAC